jgi:hypothetical protein
VDFVHSGYNHPIGKLVSQSVKLRPIKPAGFAGNCHLVKFCGRGAD